VNSKCTVRDRGRFGERLWGIFTLISAGGQGGFSGLVPDVVCISALPPFAIDHARALYQKLRSRTPESDIVICLWHYEGDMEKTVRRLKISDAQSVQTTLGEVLEHIAARAKPSSVEVGRMARAQEVDAGFSRSSLPSSTTSLP
jgi:hypothetical protein